MAGGGAAEPEEDPISRLGGANIRGTHGSLSYAKRMELQCRFKMYDTSGDNKLDREELKSLLIRGDPGITDGMVTKLFREIDRNGDGCIDFDEFVDFLWDRSMVVVPTPPELRSRICAVYGEQLDPASFVRLCMDCKLLDARFKQADAEEIFARVLPRGKRKVGMDSLDKLLCAVAERKGTQPERVHEQMLACRKLRAPGALPDLMAPEAGRGLELSVTPRAGSPPCRRPSAPPPPPLVRGPLALPLAGIAAGVERERLDVALPSSSRARSHSRCSSDDGLPPVRGSSKSATHAAASDEGEWASAERTFAAFCRQGNKFVERKDFAKICEECGIMDARFQRVDADIVFSAVTGQQKKAVDFDVFKQAVRLIAERKSCAIRELQRRLDSKFPKLLAATRAEDAPRPSGDWTKSDEAEAMEDRRQRIALAALRHTGGEETDWAWVRKSWKSFTSSPAGMEGAEFRKLCEDCALLDANFKRSDVDVLFTKQCTRRHMDFDQFKEALRAIADRTGRPTADLQRAVGYSAGPTLRFTKAEPIRLHDDSAVWPLARLHADADDDG